MHGWAGLDWIGYFHWAIPAGAALFLGWLFVSVPARSNVQRSALVLTAAVAGAIWFQVVLFALYYHFNTGPSAFLQMLAVGESTYSQYADVIYTVVPATPLLFAGLLFAFGFRPKTVQLILALLVYALACPVSVVILAVLDHRGGADAIHTIKSGIIIPFLVIGLGILVPMKGQGQQSPAGDVQTAAPEE